MQRRKSIDAVEMVSTYDVDDPKDEPEPRFTDRNPPNDQTQETLRAMSKERKRDSFTPNVEPVNPPGKELTQEEAMAIERKVNRKGPKLRAIWTR
jgi:hypothetical protein